MLSQKIILYRCTSGKVLNNAFEAPMHRAKGFKAGAMYSMEDAELEIVAPKNRSIVLGPTLVVKYALIVHDKERFEAQNHAIHACFHVLNSLDEIVSRNYVPGVSARMNILLYCME